MSNAVSIKRQAVLDLIRQQTHPITSKDMARCLGVKEVSVRAAITWLVLGGYIRKGGHIVRRYEGKSYKKRIALYEWTGRSDPICQVRVSEVDAHEREKLLKRYGDGGLELHALMLGWCA